MKSKKIISFTVALALASSSVNVIGVSAQESGENTGSAVTELSSQAESDTSSYSIDSGETENESSDSEITTDSSSVADAADSSQSEFVLPEVTETTKSVKTNNTNYTLTWDSAEQIDFYRIYSIADDGTYNLFADNITASNYLVGQLERNRKYIFKIVGIVNNENNEYEIPIHTEIVYVKIQNPKITKASSTENGVRFYWDKVDGAEKYSIYKKTANGYTKVATFSNRVNNYFVPGKSGETITVKITAISKIGEYDIESVYSSALSATVKPAKVTNLKSVNNSANANKISWSAVPNADGYHVYQWLSNGTWKRVGITSDTTFTNRDKKSGTKYIYKVRAYVKNAKGTKIYGEYSDTLTTCTKPEKVSFKTSSTGYYSITFNWNKVSKASGYEVYQKVNGNWEKIKNTKSTKITVKKLQAGKSCSIKVRAYRELNGTKYYGAFTTKTSITNRKVKTNAGINIRKSANGSSAVLKYVSKGTVLTQYGKAENGWVKVKVPGTNAKGYVKSSNVGNYQNLSIKAISQVGYEGGSPLPLGCESTALATVLKRQFGIDVSKNTIADNYVPRVREGQGDPNYAFWNSPYDSSPCYGVYAPAIAQAANWYLNDIGARNSYHIDLHTDYSTTNNPNGYAIETSKLSLGETTITDGLTFSEIKAELDKGNSVIVWFTAGSRPSYKQITYNIPRGTKYSNSGSGSYSFTWYGHQHCAVLEGYDDSTGCFIMSDVAMSQWSNCHRYFTYSSFKNGYNALGRQTVVISKILPEEQVNS